jgi:hypothetical protein
MIVLSLHTAESLLLLSFAAVYLVSMVLWCFLAARVQALRTDIDAKNSYTLRMASTIRTHSENGMCNYYTHLDGLLHT